MSKLSTEHTFLALLPILFVLIAIIGAIVFFPQNTDNRSKASEPKAVPTIVKIPPPAPNVASPKAGKATQKPVTECTELYKPVCGRDGKTYSTACEANLQGIIVASEGSCKSL